MGRNEGRKSTWVWCRLERILPRDFEQETSSSAPVRTFPHGNQAKIRNSVPKKRSKENTLALENLKAVLVAFC